MAVGDVIKWFASPSTDPRGLTWDCKTLWHSDRFQDRIYQINPITGAVIRNFASPDLQPMGLAWDGKTLWVITDNLDRVYQLEMHS